jgi:hypothetical protein
MSRVDDVGDREAWRCWLCDQPVDRDMSVNDPRGPSVDNVTVAATSKKGKDTVLERLAHRACNTRKGAVTAVAPWPDHLFVVDPAPIIPTVATLERKGGRAIVARCPTRGDADAAAEWLADRLTRLRPDAALDTSVDAGGGQFVVVLRAR